MKRKIFITFFVIILIIGLNFLVVLVEDNKISEISSETYIFEKKLLIFFYIFFLITCGYFKFYGIRHSASKRYGGIVKEKEVDYCRELPESLGLELAYVSLYRCSKIKTKKLKNGIIGAFILKWYNNNNIVIKDKGNKIFSIDLLDGKFEKTKVEQELYDLLKFAAGSNNIIDNEEFKRWSRGHKKILKKWHNDLVKGIYNVNLRTETEALIGLKKFLLDYSLIEERKHIEIDMWKNYLIYAQLMGISDEVSKELTKIYPDYSKIGEISVMNKNELLVELVLTWLFFGVFAYVIAMIPANIISAIYYIIQLR